MPFSHTKLLRKRTSGISHSSSETKDTAELQRRIHMINNAIARKDIAELRKLAVTGPGLVNDGLRRLAWPLLLRCEKGGEAREADEHSDEAQAKLDVERSFVYLPKGIRTTAKKQYQRDLQEIIASVLRRHLDLHYYQGFHDICSVLLIVLGKQLAIAAAENIAMFLLRDAMLDSLEPILRQLMLLDTILQFEDPQIHKFMTESNILPYFGLSWVITWCSHDIKDVGKVARLFDFFISSNPLMSVYLAARLVISRRQELLMLERDNASIHTFLSKFPQNIDIDDIITKTQGLYHKYPPAVLQKLSGDPLDDTSCVNTYKRHWSSLKPNAPVDYSLADLILTIPQTRKPLLAS